RIRAVRRVAARKLTLRTTVRFNTVRTPNTPAAILGAMLCGWTLLTGCGQEPLPQGASNLLAVDDVAFVCTRTEDADGVHVERGVPLHECTERENLEEHALLALATQWET